MWLILALLTAFFTSLQDVTGKKIINRVDVYIIAWGWIVFSLPFLYIYLFVQKVPSIDGTFIKALMVSTVILTFASVYYFKAIKYSDLSICMPMLTFTPLFLLVTSPLIVGEFAGPMGILGILVIIGGSYVLCFQKRSKGFLEPFKHLIRERGPRYMLVVAFLFSIGANVDKIGVIHSSPIMWITALNSLLAIVLGVIVMFRVKNVFEQIKAVWIYLLIIGFFNAAALIFQMTAIEMTLVPYLIAVKRTSAVMTSLFGFFLFKEQGMRERLVGASLMIGGVFIIAFFQ